MGSGVWNPSCSRSGNSKLIDPASRSYLQGHQQVIWPWLRCRVSTMGEAEHKADDSIFSSLWDHRRTDESKIRSTISSYCPLCQHRGLANHIRYLQALLMQSLHQSRHIHIFDTHPYIQYLHSINAQPFPPDIINSPPSTNPIP